MMKLLRRLSGRQFVVLLGLALILWVSNGCGSLNSQDFPTGAGMTDTNAGPRFAVGDVVKVTFSGIDSPLAPQEETVKEDGSITLQHIGSVKAEGLTLGELQRKLQTEYNHLFTTLTVTVTAPMRVYYVDGEVTRPSALVYQGGTTVTRAIAAAGGFTEFANKRKVKLTRGDRTITVDCQEAVKDPKKDRAVFPADKITVPRRIFW